LKPEEKEDQIVSVRKSFTLTKEELEREVPVFSRDVLLEEVPILPGKNMTVWLLIHDESKPRSTNPVQVTISVPPAGVEEKPIIYINKPSEVEFITDPEPVIEKPIIELM